MERLGNVEWPVSFDCAGRVDFAAFVASLDIEEIMALTDGQLVDYVSRCLSSPRDGE